MISNRGAYCFPGAPWNQAKTKVLGIPNRYKDQGDRIGDRGHHLEVDQLSDRLERDEARDQVGSR
jgi:hypothetical protein